MGWFDIRTLLLLIFVTGNTVSSSSNHSGPTTFSNSFRKEPRVDNNKQATIWLASPGDHTAAFRFHCTGTIISRQHVLTAASCADRLDKRTLLVSEAKDHLSESKSFSPVLNVTLSQEYDLAVLRVSPDFFPSQSVVQLLADDLHVATDDKCTVGGWLPGSNMWAYEGVLYVSNEDCSEIYSQLATPFNKKHVCSIPEVGNTTCKVGLGWSLVCDGQLTGVFTWTHHSCEKPSVYASVESATLWIAAFNGAATHSISSVLLTLTVAMLAWRDL